MNVKINDDYYIESDNRNFVLRSRILRKARNGDGENEYFEYFYFGRLEDLFNNLIQRVVRNSEITTLTEMKELIAKTRKEVEECVKSSDLKVFMQKREEIAVGSPTPAVAPVKRGRGRPKKVR